MKKCTCSMERDHGKSVHVAWSETMEKVYIDYESHLGSRPFYHEPQQMLDRGNSRLLPFIGFFSLVCPSLR